MKEFFMNIKNIATIVGLISLITTSAIAIESRYVLTAEFQQFRAQDQYKWSQLKLEKLDERVLRILDKLEKNPADKFLKDMLQETKNKRIKLLKIIEELEKEYGLNELTK